MMGADPSPGIGLVGWGSCVHAASPLSLAKPMTVAPPDVTRIPGRIAIPRIDHPTTTGPLSHSLRTTDPTARTPIARQSTHRPHNRFHTDIRGFVLMISCLGRPLWLRDESTDRWDTCDQRRTPPGLSKSRESWENLPDRRRAIGEGTMGRPSARLFGIIDCMGIVAAAAVRPRSIDRRAQPRSSGLRTPSGPALRMWV